MSNFTSQMRTGVNRLLRPLCSTKHYEIDFFNRCVSCWNFAPAVVNATSISCFKRFLSITLIGQHLHIVLKIIIVKGPAYGE